MNYSQAIDYLLSMPDKERFISGPYSQTMGVPCMRALLAAIGNPHLNRRTIHITGSKGKGSTSLFITSILNAAGFSTALYSSPHLHDFTERISINLQPVSKEVFAKALTEIRPAIESVHSQKVGPVSTFGAMTALYFYLAQQFNADWQIVEVGLGGTHDGTNIFDSKDVAVITPISLEHTQILGNSITEIAENKAGIITAGCTTIMANQKDATAKAVIEKQCRELKSELIDVSSLYKAEPKEKDLSGQSFSLTGPKGKVDLRISMLGRHQIENASTAYAAIESLKNISIPKEAISKGLAEAKLAGRLEILSTNPYLIVDGAHNGESMQVLVQAIKDNFSFNKCIMIFGANQDKNLTEIFKQLKDLQPLLIASRSQNSKAYTPEQIAAAAQEFGIQTITADSAAEALNLARQKSSNDDLICATGSLYIVGETRELLLSPATI